MTDEYGPETEVWHKGTLWKTGGGEKVTVHLEPDCMYLKRASHYRGPKKLKHCPDDWKVCAECRGVLDRSGGAESRKKTLALMSEDFGPEDAGLSPLGERNE